MATAAIMRRFRGGNQNENSGGQSGGQTPLASHPEPSIYGLPSQAVPFYAGGYPGAYGGPMAGGLPAGGFGGGFPGGSAAFAPGANPSTYTASFGGLNFNTGGFGGAPQASTSSAFAPGGFGGLPAAGGVPYGG
ncbi:hypothetical protein V5799_020062 [Amblyomma americanum]|uniref:Uncharacterized protein n=1 Tax=Amblyomma americanum TaxID=6943 RepID=A0AAQ4EUW7_AMBAM